MSGIEVAGFVLAAFPILISALEDYRQGWEILEDWWKIKREYKKCKNDLNIERLVFDENLEQLLSPLVHNDDEMEKLLAEPGGKLWKDAGLEHGLKERLPKSYGIYLETIHEILTIMDSLKKELGVDVSAFQNSVEEAKLLLEYRSTPDVELKVDFVFSDDFKHTANRWSYRRTTIKQVNSLQSNLAQEKRLDDPCAIPTIPPESRAAIKTTHSLALRPSLKTSRSINKKGVQWQTTSPTGSVYRIGVNSTPVSVMDICNAFATTQSVSLPFECILLLELCFGVALEDNEIRRNFPTLDGEANSALDLVAAMQWCDRDAHDEAGQEFADAIKWCLRPSSIGLGGGKEQGWREELWAQVVDPLQYW
ncbi:hypothetical protein P7C71_g2816, partial [Lecanoromycetidae sp. Uapishka_2]